MLKIIKLYRYDRRNIFLKKKNRKKYELKIQFLKWHFIWVSNVYVYILLFTILCV